MSEILRAKWRDPAYREKMRLVREANLLERKANPKKYARTRIPDGMRKKKALMLWEKAETLADEIMNTLKEEGDLPNVVVPGSDEAKAEAALKEAFVMAIGPGDAKIKTANIRTILEWTKAKPESKSKITLDKAEDWLAKAQADMDDAAY